VSGDVEEQGRLTDTRLSREQDHSARNDPSAEHPVKFANTGREVAALDSRVFGDRFSRFISERNNSLDLL
jgi:hypothetical protein